jgi:hypothetical protein
MSDSIRCKFCGVTEPVPSGAKLSGGPPPIEAKGASSRSIHHAPRCSWAKAFRGGPMTKIRFLEKHGESANQALEIVIGSTR